MRSKSFYKAVVVFIFLALIIGLSFAKVTDIAVIQNTGRIIPEVAAKSGYWRDIQDAVNTAASLGIGIVRIPEGTWNFVNVGESWTGARVTVPAGVSIFGAPTQRYANGSVVEWKTVLQMPWDMPGSKSNNPPHWFLFSGTGNPDKPIRFSDIQLNGYGALNSSAVGFYRAIRIDGVQNFRIDHCFFNGIREGIAVGVAGYYESCGVIDHNVFDNENVYYTVNWGERVVGYGIAIYRREFPSVTTWVPITDLLGKYVNYSVYIENNVFTKWRSIVMGNFGAHYVFRYNVVENGLGYGEMDLHPSWTSPAVSCRAAEVYSNIFRNPGYAGFVTEMFGGGGVFFNNTVSGYNILITDSATNWDPTTQGPKEVYIWNNGFSRTIEDGWMQENVHYFLRAPNLSQDGFEYTPYTYPHPLTLK